MSITRAAAQKETLEAFVSAWKALDVEAMAALYAEDLQFVGLPTAVLGGKERTRQQWINFIKPMWAELSNFKVELHSTTIDGSAGRGVLHANTYADLPFMPYRNEHIMIFRFDDSGKKIVKLQDMMDSVFAKALNQGFAIYKESKG